MIFKSAFFGRIPNNAEIELLQQINSAISEEKEAKGRRKKAEEALGKLRRNFFS